MTPIDSTAEILLWKHLNESVDERWKNWAYEMINAGFESEHLIELAGILKPYNQFELQSLTTKVLDELQLNYTDEKKVVCGYVNYIVSQVLEHKSDLLQALRKLKELYLGKDIRDLQDFAMLYWAKEDLNYSEVQHYWPEGDRTTIDKIILDYFMSWEKANTQI